MKEVDDFAKGERGKFYRADAGFHLPVYLEPDVESFMSELAEQKGVDVQVLVNEWLRTNIKLVQSSR